MMMKRSKGYLWIGGVVMCMMIVNLCCVHGVDDANELWQNAVDAMESGTSVEVWGTPVKTHGKAKADAEVKPDADAEAKPDAGDSQHFRRVCQKVVTDCEGATTIDSVPEDIRKFNIPCENYGQDQLVLLRGLCEGTDPLNWDEFKERNKDKKGNNKALHQLSLYSNVVRVRYIGELVMECGTESGCTDDTCDCQANGSEQWTSDYDLSCMGPNVNKMTRCVNERFRDRHHAETSTKFDCNVYGDGMTVDKKMYPSKCFTKVTNKKGDDVFTMQEACGNDPTRNQNSWAFVHLILYLDENDIDTGDFQSRVQEFMGVGSEKYGDFLKEWEVALRLYSELKPEMFPKEEATKEEAKDAPVGERHRARRGSITVTIPRELVDGEAPLSREEQHEADRLQEHRNKKYVDCLDILYGNYFNMVESNCIDACSQASRCAFWAAEAYVGGETFIDVVKNIQNRGSTELVVSLDGRFGSFVENIGDALKVVKHKVESHSESSDAKSEPVTVLSAKIAPTDPNLGKFEEDIVSVNKYVYRALRAATGGVPNKAAGFYKPGSVVSKYCAAHRDTMRSKFMCFDWGECFTKAYDVEWGWKQLEDKSDKSTRRTLTRGVVEKCFSVIKTGVPDQRVLAYNVPIAKQASSMKEILLRLVTVGIANYYETRKRRRSTRVRPSRGRGRSTRVIVRPSRGRGRKERRTEPRPRSTGEDPKPKPTAKKRRKTKKKKKQRETRDVLAETRGRPVDRRLVIEGRGVTARRAATRSTSMSGKQKRKLMKGKKATERLRSSSPTNRLNRRFF